MTSCLFGHIILIGGTHQRIQLQFAWLYRLLVKMIVDIRLSPLSSSSCLQNPLTLDAVPWSHHFMYTLNIVAWENPYGLLKTMPHLRSLWSLDFPILIWSCTETDQQTKFSFYYILYLGVTCIEIRQGSYNYERSVHLVCLHRSCGHKIRDF